MLKNFLALCFSTGSKLVINAGILIILARYLGAVNYGVLATSLATTSIIVIILDFGFATYIVKTVAENRTLVKGIMAQAVALKIYLSIIYIVACEIGKFLLVEKEYYPIFDIIIFVTFANSYIDFLNIPFRAISKFHIEAKTSFISSVVHLFLIIPISILYSDLYYVCYAYLIAKIITLYICCHAYKKEFGYLIKPKRLDLTLNNIFIEFNKIKYYGLDSAIVNIRSNIDTVIIKSLLGYENAGIYQAASTIIKSAEKIGPIFANLYLPKLSKIDKNLIKYVKQLIILMVVTSISVSVFLLNINFNFVLGSKFSSVTPLIKLMCVYLVIRYICMGIGVYITAIGLQKLRVDFGIINLIIAIILNYWLTKSYGLHGAVYAMIFTSVTLFLLYLMAIINRSLSNKVRT